MLAVTFLGYSIPGREFVIIGAVVVIIVLIGIVLAQRRIPEVGPARAGLPTGQISLDTVAGSAPADAHGPAARDGPHHGRRVRKV